MTDSVRPFTHGDIAPVADLHRRVFRPDAPDSADDSRQYPTYFEDTFLHGPRRDDTCPSLVYVDDRGRIGGFVGVARRAMTFGGRPLQAAVSSQFMVDTTMRPAVAAVRLLKAFLAGPQDLSLADEATGPARRLWESVGGATAPLFSLSWVRVLRPAAFAASRARGPHAIARAAAAAPVWRIADAIAARLPGPFHVAHVADGRAGAHGTYTAEPLDGATLRACIDEVPGGLALRPAFDEGSAGALLDVLAHKQGAGELQTVALRDTRGRLAGWYLYHATRGGIGEVLHVGAQPRAAEDVLDHLFFDARKRGVTALIGRLDPAFMSALATRNCVFRHRGEWVLVHARAHGALEAVQRGDAFLSRLVGEWPLRYRVGLA